MNSIFSALLNKLQTVPTIYICTFLFFITLVAYANTFGNGLFYDDEQFIYKNVYVQNFQVIEYFTKNVDAGAGVVSNYYRPLTLLTFGIEHLFFGFASFIYHFDNFLLHTFCGITLYLILKKLFPKFIALITSTLFLIHPIQTEAVSYAAGRSDSLALLFMLLTIITFLSENKKIHYASIPLFFLALLGKEPAIVTPALILLITLYKTNSLPNTISSIKRLIPLLITGGFYFFLRLTVLNFQNTLNFYNDTSPYATNIFVRLYTFLSIIPTYIGLLIYPKTLFIERTAEIVTTPTLFVASIFILILFLFSLGSLLFAKKQPILLFSLLWFFISIALASGIAIPINGVIYEHFLYLPSVGVFLFFAYLIHWVLQRIEKPIFSFLLLGSLCLIILCFTLRTISRNAEWRDPITFYTQTLHHSPNTARIHNNLAMAYAEEGRNSDAITSYKKALQINNTYPQIHFNLGNSYISEGKYDEAEKEYRETIKLSPEFINAYVNLGRLYKQTNKKKFEALLTEIDAKAQTNSSFSELASYLRSL